VSLKLGKIKGININLNYSWFLIFFFITWNLSNNYLPGQYPDKSSVFYNIVGLLSTLSLYLSILIHELAHSIIAKRKGINIKNITLHFFGGVAQINEESTDPKTEAYMAIAGPFTSFILGGIFLIIYTIIGTILPDTIEAVFRYTGYVNLGLAFFNLIPAFPMDGGRFLRAILWSRNENLIKSTQIASSISGIISLIFTGVGFFNMFSSGTLNGLWLVFLGLFLNSISKIGLSQTIISEALDEVTVQEIMTKEVKTVEPDTSVQRVIDEWFSVYKHQGYPVTVGDKLVGIITLDDIRKVDVDKRTSIKVRDVMKSKNELIFINPSEKASDAWMKMATSNVGRLPVIDNGELVGIITRSDISKTIQIKTQFED
jgi:Zn-dependent protease/CBS domain-containing protein